MVPRWSSVMNLARTPSIYPTYSGVATAMPNTGACPMMGAMPPAIPTPMMQNGVTNPVMPQSEFSVLSSEIYLAENQLRVGYQPGQCVVRSMSDNYSSLSYTVCYMVFHSMHILYSHVVVYFWLTAAIWNKLLAMHSACNIVKLFASHVTILQWVLCWI